MRAPPAPRLGPLTAAFALAMTAALALAVAPAAAGATAHVRYGWGRPFGLDSRRGIEAIACPSRHLCVAVDDAGGIVASRTPAIARSWHRVDADGSTSLAGIACPTAGLCLAVDNAGGVLSSVDPTGPASAWAAADIDPGTPLAAISCAPGSTFCAAVDVRGNAFVSSDPRGGTPAWTGFHVDNGMNYECFHYSEGSCVGTASPLAVSCASAALCAEADDSGYVFWSQDPAAGSAAWTHSIGGAEPVSEGDNGIACPTTSLCAFVDDIGGAVASFDPRTGTGPGPVVLGGELAGITCPSARVCLAYGDGPLGDVYVSSTPARGGWTAQTIASHAFVDALGCAPTLCVASEGLDAVVGQPLPGPAALARELRRALRRLTAGLRPGRPLAHRITATAPGPGRLTLTLRSGATLLARASGVAMQAGAVRLTVAGTGAGLALTPGESVTARLTYAPAGVRAATVSGVRRLP